MGFNKTKFWDSIFTGAGMAILYKAFFVEYSMLAYVAGALGCICIPSSIILGSYESVDNQEVRSK